MSHTYYVKGYIDVRIHIDTDINHSQSATSDDVANTVLFNTQCRIGKCTMLGHSIIIDGLRKHE